MMYATAEPYAFEIYRHVDEVGVGAVAFVVGVDRLKHFAYAQVVFAILIKEDVASAEGGFTQIVDKFFLLEGEFVEPVHLVAEHLQVGKLLVGVLEIVSRLCGGA
jgi:hypothetical protein